MRDDLAHCLQDALTSATSDDVLLALHADPTSAPFAASRVREIIEEALRSEQEATIHRQATHLQDLQQAQKLAEYEKEAEQQKAVSLKNELRRVEEERDEALVKAKSGDKKFSTQTVQLVAAESALENTKKAIENLNSKCEVLRKASTDAGRDAQLSQAAAREARMDAQARQLKHTQAVKRIEDLEQSMHEFESVKKLFETEKCEHAALRKKYIELRSRATSVAESLRRSEQQRIRLAAKYASVGTKVESLVRAEEDMSVQVAERSRAALASVKEAAARERETALCTVTTLKNRASKAEAHVYELESKLHKLTSDVEKEVERANKAELSERELRATREGERAADLARAEASDERARTAEKRTIEREKEANQRVELLVRNNTHASLRRVHAHYQRELAQRIQAAEAQKVKEKEQVSREANNVANEKLQTLQAQMQASLMEHRQHIQQEMAHMYHEEQIKLKAHIVQLEKELEKEKKRFKRDILHERRDQSTATTSLRANNFDSDSSDYLSMNDARRSFDMRKQLEAEKQERTQMSIEMTQRISAADAERMRAMEEMKQAKNVTASAQLDLAALRRDLSERTDALQHANTTAEAETERRRALCRHLDDASRNIARLTSIVDDEQAKRVAVERQILEQCNELVTATEARKDAEAKREDIEQKLKDAENRVCDAEKTMAEQKNRLISMESHLSASTAQWDRENERLIQAVTAAEQRAGEVLADADARTSAAESQCASAVAAANTTAAESADAKLTSNAAVKAHAELNNELSKMHQRLSEAETALSVAQENARQALSEAAAERKKIDALRSENLRKQILHQTITQTVSRDCARIRGAMQKISAEWRGIHENWRNFFQTAETSLRIAATAAFEVRKKHQIQMIRDTQHQKNTAVHAAEIEAAHREHLAQKSSAVTVEKAREDAQQAEEKARVNIEQWKNVADNAQKIARDWAEKADKAEAEIQSAHNAVKQESEHVLDLQSRLNNEHQKIKELKQKIQELNTRNKTLSEQSVFLVNRKARLVALIDVLRAEGILADDITAKRVSECEDSEIATETLKQGIIAERERIKILATQPFRAIQDNLQHDLKEQICFVATRDAEIAATKKEVISITEQLTVTTQEKTILHDELLEVKTNIAAIQRDSELLADKNKQEIEQIKRDADMRAELEQAMLPSPSHSTSSRQESPTHHHYRSGSRLNAQAIAEHKRQQHFILQRQIVETSNDNVNNHESVKSMVPEEFEDSFHKEDNFTQDNKNDDITKLKATNEFVIHSEKSQEDQHLQTVQLELDRELFCAQESIRMAQESLVQSRNDFAFDDKNSNEFFIDDCARFQTPTHNFQSEETLTKNFMSPFNEEFHTQVLSNKHENIDTKLVYLEENNDNNKEDSRRTTFDADKEICSAAEINQSTNNLIARSKRIRQETSTN